MSEIQLKDKAPAIFLCCHNPSWCVLSSLTTAPIIFLFFFFFLGGSETCFKSHANKQRAMHCWKSSYWNPLLSEEVEELHAAMERHTRESLSQSQLIRKLTLWLLLWWLCCWSVLVLSKWSLYIFLSLPASFHFSPRWWWFWQACWYLPLTYISFFTGPVPSGEANPISMLAPLQLITTLIIFSRRKHLIFWGCIS